MRLDFPLVLAFTGRFGSGKTAFASYLAVNTARDMGVSLWANYDLVGSQPVRSIEELYLLRDGVLILDELQGTVHARSFSKNLPFMDWFDQHRKQGLIFIYITQELRKVDVLVRDMTDFAFICERIDSRYSRYQLVDMSTEKIKSSGVFDRSLSYSLYDHRARAWAVDGAREGRKSERAASSNLKQK